MNILFLAAGALMLGGSAYAYQAETDPGTAASTSTISFDPTVAITAPATWTDEQRMLWEQHMATLPADWTAAERAMFQSMIATPPVNWTMEQRTLYSEHLAQHPADWTTEQQSAYDQQIAGLRTPWMGSRTASMAGGPGPTTLAMAPASGRIVQPSNADPEHDARGIAVVSDPAVVPDGYNGHAAGTGTGGPLVDAATGETIDAGSQDYPPCTATVTDNCIQLYERGVRAQTGVGGPFQPVAGETGSSATSKPAAPSTTGTSTTTIPNSSDMTAKPAGTEDHGNHPAGSTTTEPDPTGTTKDDTTQPDL